MMLGRMEVRTSGATHLELWMDERSHHWLESLSETKRWDIGYVPNVGICIVPGTQAEFTHEREQLGSLRYKLEFHGDRIRWFSDILCNSTMEAECVGMIALGRRDQHVVFIHVGDKR